MNSGLVGISVRVRISQETECLKFVIYKISAESLLSFTLLLYTFKKNSVLLQQLIYTVFTFLIFIAS